MRSEPVVHNEADMPDDSSRDALACAVQALERGQAVAFPTDTVAGVAVSVAHVRTPQVLYDIKQRDERKPIAWLVGSPDAVAHYGAHVAPYVHTLVQAFWPGCLTVIVNAAPAVPQAFRGPNATIALRMPDHPLPLALMQQLGSPLATSSANKSGAVAPGSADAIDPDVRQAVACVLEGGTHATGRASTVLDCTGESPVVVREGDVTAAQIEALLS